MVGAATAIAARVASARLSFLMFQSSCNCPRENGGTAASFRWERGSFYERTFIGQLAFP
jgi:hypothetical protein